MQLVNLNLLNGCNMYNLTHLTQQQLTWIVYGIGVICSYVRWRNINRNLCNNVSWCNYTYSRVVGNFAAAFGSWLLFIIGTILWLCDNDFRSDTRKDPPKWL